MRTSDIYNVRFGKLNKKRDPRTLSLKSVLKTDELPSIPKIFMPVQNLSSLKFQMYGNDEIGDCTAAKMGNLEIFWGKIKHGDDYIAPSQDQVIKAYSEITGYVPGDESTDNGAYLLDVLNWWRHHMLAHRLIVGYGEIQLQNIDLLDASVFLFQNADLGIEVPESMMEDVQAGKDVWDVPSKRSPIIGGHNIPAIAYDNDYIYVASWGQVYKMTKAFYYTYCDEAYAMIGHEYMVDNKTIVNGVDMRVLKDYLQNLAA